MLCFSFSGFSVNASSERLNMGEIETPQDYWSSWWGRGNLSHSPTSASMRGGSRTFDSTRPKNILLMPCSGHHRATSHSALQSRTSVEHASPSTHLGILLGNVVKALWVGREWVMGNITLLLLQYCPVSFQRLVQSVTFSTVIRWGEEAFGLNFAPPLTASLGLSSVDFL